MRYLLGAVALIALGAWLWYDWRRWHDPKRFMIAIALVGAGLFFTLLTRSMLVYKPLMLLHMASLLLYGAGAVRFLAGGRLHPILTAPLVTSILFFLFGGSVAWHM